MKARGIRILVVVVAVAVLAAGVVCLFHDDDLHAGAGHLCLSAVLVLAMTLPLVIHPPARLVVAGPLARRHVMLDLLAPPPRG